VVLALVVLALPALVSTFWIRISTSVAIYSIVALSLALLMGRVGLVSLGQIALLAVGGWIALRLGFAFSLPFPVLLLATGVITGAVGTLIGLPALRLSGLYLALITLMAAAGITLALQATNFPNGGGGFKGRAGTGALTTETPPVRRPSWTAGRSRMPRCSRRSRRYGRRRTRRRRPSS